MQYANIKYLIGLFFSHEFFFSGQHESFFAKQHIFHLYADFFFNYMNKIFSEIFNVLLSYNSFFIR